jgi:exodeoxyribonuclease VII small subunit
MSPRARQPDPSEPAAPEPTFDQRIDRLEQIVAELEQGRIGLEAAIERYQEGTALVRQCRAVLDAYQKRVEELSDAGLAPYAADPDAKSSG